MTSLYNKIPYIFQLIRKFARAIDKFYGKGRREARRGAWLPERTIGLATVGENAPVRGGVHDLYHRPFWP